MSQNPYVMTIVADPLKLFEPGAVYTCGEIAAFMEEDELPLGLTVQNGRLWTVIDTGDGLALENTDGQRLDAEALRALLLGNHREVGVRWQVLRAIAEISDRLGVPPSFREIAQEVGVALSVVHYHVTNLEHLGLVSHEPRKWRTLVLTDAGLRRLGRRVL